MVSTSPRTPAAGISCTSGGLAAKAFPTASALSTPLTTNHTSSARLRASKVRVTRSGGGLGESVTGTAIAPGVELRVAGEQRGHVSVGTDAEHHQLEATDADGADGVGVRRRRVVDRGHLVGGRHLVHAGRVDPDEVEDGAPGVVGVAVGGVVAVRGEAGDLSVDVLGDAAPGEGHLRDLARGLGHGDQADERSGHGGGQVGGVLVDLDAGRGCRCGRCGHGTHTPWSFTRRRAVAA